MIDHLLGVSRASARRPAMWALAHLVPTLLLGLGIFRLDIRTDGASIHPRDHPVVRATAADRRAFEENEQVIVLLHAPDGATSLASAAGFEVLARLHRDLEQLPEVQSERVRSLANLVEPPREGLLRPFRSLLDPIPADARDLEERLERIWSHPLAAGLFLSSDGRAAAIYVPIENLQRIDGGADRGALLSRLEAWAREADAEPFEILLTGPVVAEVRLGRAVLEDLRTLVPVVVLVMALLLALVFRSPGGVLVPLAQVVLVLAWTLGFMGWLGVPVTLVTTLLPVVLMTVTVLDEMHLLVRLRTKLAPDPAAPLAPAVDTALREIARPVVATSVTSALAFLSFVSASLPPVRHFGIFAAVGTLIAMGLTFSLAPAWILLLPKSWVPRERMPARSGAKLQLPGIEEWLVARRGGALLLSLVFCAVAVPGALQLRVQDSWVDNFDPRSPIARADRIFNEKLWGSYRLDVVCRAPAIKSELAPQVAGGFFLQPEGFRLVERIHQLARNSPSVGGAVTHLLPFELIARSQGYERPLSTLTPLKISSLLRRVKLIAARIDFDHFLSPAGDVARVRLLVRNPDFRRGQALEERLHRGLDPLTAGSGVVCQTSGELPVAQAVVGSVVSNQLRSMALTLLAVGALIWLLVRSLRQVGALLLPVAAAAWVVFGAMGSTGLPLGVATSMFAALAIGVGVDFGLHFEHAYRRGRVTADPEHALRSAFATAGSALRLNALVLVAGFLVLTHSALLPNRSLGWLLAAVIASAYWMTVSLLPYFLAGRREQAEKLDRAAGLAGSGASDGPRQIFSAGPEGEKRTNEKIEGDG